MTQETKTVETAPFAGLSNEEILMIYYRFKSYLERTNQNLKNKKMSKPMDTPLGPAMAFTVVRDSHIQKFVDSEFYHLTNDVVNKLQPIVELLEECDEYKSIIKQIK
jgi:hypothetical protein